MIATVRIVDGRLALNSLTEAKPDGGIATFQIVNSKTAVSMLVSPMEGLQGYIAVGTFRFIHV